MTMDFDPAPLAIGLASLAILGLLAWGVAAGVARWARARRTAPFFARLKRHGMTLTQAEQEVGFRQLGRMAAGCKSCVSRGLCRRELRWGWIPFARARCPNAAFFAATQEVPKDDQP